MNDHRVEFYVDLEGKHRWQIKNGNGRIVGASTQGYARRSYCERNLRKVAEVGITYTGGVTLTTNR